MEKRNRYISFPLEPRRPRPHTASDATQVGVSMFNSEKFYTTDDPTLLVLGRPSTLAHWRSEGRGPSFIKVGSRVLYSGRALNEWIASRTVEHKAA